MSKSYSDKEIFVAGSNIGRSVIRRRILANKLIPYKCAECKNKDIWNNKPLSLHLDHKNGICNDHRLDNLRFLCPNCHSQTETYGSKNSIPMNNIIKKPNYRKIKLLKDRKLWEIVKQENIIEIGAWGWKTRLARLLSISEQKINNWLARVDPNFQLV